jgi:hypothetical protein
MHRSGYQFSPNQRVLTLFTASDYLRSQNTGAVLTIDPSVSLQVPNLFFHFQLTLSFTLFRPISRKKRQKERRRAANQARSVSTSQEVDVNMISE